MEYVVQAFKVLKNLVQAEANTISLRDYQLILCMFGFLH